MPTNSSRSVGGLDVLVRLEQVVGVPLAFEGVEAFVPLPVRFGNSFGLVVTEIVHVDTVGRLRFQRLMELTRPADMFVVPL